MQNLLQNHDIVWSIMTYSILKETAAGQTLKEIRRAWKNDIT